VKESRCERLRRWALRLISNNLPANTCRVCLGSGFQRMRADHSGIAGQNIEWCDTCGGNGKLGVLDIIMREL
jgi:hypothetical protein